MKRVDKDIVQTARMLGYGSMGVVCVAGLFLLAKYFVKRGRRNNAEKQSSQEAQPATYAKYLKMAFENDNYFGWGTNTALVYQVLHALPSKTFYEKVQQKYKDLYNRPLDADLKEELTGSEYIQVVNILKLKPKR